MELNKHTTLILGMPNFSCASIAHRLRDLGHDIPKKAGSEQAYAINWMLELYEKHGDEWRDVADSIFRQEQDDE